MIDLLDIRLSSGIPLRVIYVPTGSPGPVSGTDSLAREPAVEFYDRRDKSFWPFIRLPVIYFGGRDGPALVDSIRELCALKREGFAFRTGAQDELTFQIGRQQGGGFIVEVGIDLAPYLHETSGLQGEPGRELSLWRFTTSTAELVRFADQVKQELEKLPPLRQR
jgi:hypothetical protein